MYFLNFPSLIALCTLPKQCKNVKHLEDIKHYLTLFFLLFSQFFTVRCVCEKGELNRAKLLN